MFSFWFYDISKNTFSYRAPPMAASEYSLTISEEIYYSDLSAAHIIVAISLQDQV